MVAMCVVRPRPASGRIRAILEDLDGLPTTVAGEPRRSPAVSINGYMRVNETPKTVARTGNIK